MRIYTAPLVIFFLFIKHALSEQVTFDMLNLHAYHQEKLKGLICRTIFFDFPLNFVQLRNKPTVFPVYHKQKAWNFICPRLYPTSIYISHTSKEAD